MKKSNIQEIFDRRRGEDKAIHGNEKYWEIVRQNKTAHDKFYESLTAEQREQYELLTLADSDAQYEAVLNCFTEGFKTGLFIGLECAEE